MSDWSKVRGLKDKAYVEAGSLLCVPGGSRPKAILYFLGMFILEVNFIPRDENSAWILAIP